MKKNSVIISGMILGALTLSPTGAWSQPSPGTSGQSGSATQQDQQRPRSLGSSAGHSSMDSMRSSAMHGQRTPEEVRSVQEALKDKGHDPGPIDGVMGPRTQQALRAFQRAQNIQTSGQLDSSTASALGVTLSSSGGSTFGGSTSGGSSRGSSGTGSLNSGTSSGTSNRDSTTIEPNEGNPRSGGASKSGSTPGSSSRGSSGTGSVSSETSGGPNRDSTTLEPTEGNPGSGGTPRSSGSGSSSDSGKSGSSK